MNGGSQPVSGTFHVLKALLWKDYRVHRPVILFGAMMLVLPYLVGIIGVLSSQRGWEEVRFAAGLSMALTSVALTLVTMIGLAGGAFTTERETRSSEFLAGLPVSPRIHLASKIVLMAALVLGMWLFNLIPLIYLHHRDAPSLPLELAVFMDPLKLMASTGALLFGASWLASASLRRSTIASVCGLAAPVLLRAFLNGLQGAQGIGAPPLDTTYQILALVLGILGFLAGCAVYLWRSET